jgi:glycosyltransferase involved in cell wall biosynthesis
MEKGEVAVKTRSEEKYPRVLVIAHSPFNETRNNGITLSNLFRGWPRDRIAQIYFPFATPIVPEFTVCERYWAVTPAAILRGLVGKSINGEVGPAVPAERAPRAFSRGALGRFAQSLGRSQPAIDLLEPARDLLFSLPTVLSDEARQWVRDFNPDVIYSILGSVPAMDITVDLADMLGVPVVPHVTDDWPATLYSRSAFLRPLRPRVRRAFAAVLERSPVRLVISPPMAREYTQRYGGEYLAFSSVADGARFDATPPPVREGPVRFTYIGGMHLERWRSVREIALAVRAVNEAGHPATFEIYTMPDHVNSYGAQLADTGAVVQGWVPNSEVPALLAAADVLVHVESFDPNIASYTRLSISTKMPEYLLSGRPTLAYGPGIAASIAHIGNTGSGISIGKRDTQALDRAVHQLATDRELRLAMGAQARLAGEEHHEATVQREHFREAIASAVPPWSGPRRVPAAPLARAG